MPPQGIDFGRTLHNFAVDGNVIHDSVPGAWLGDSGSDSDYEEFSDPDMTRSKARAIADSALADLQRAAAEAEDERLRRQTLRERERRAAEKKALAAAAARDSKIVTWRLASFKREMSEAEERVRSQGVNEHNAAESKKLAPAVAKSSQKSTRLNNPFTAFALQSNAAGISTNKPRHSLLDPSPNSGESLSTSSITVPAQSNAPRVTSNKPSRSSHIDYSPNSDEQKTGRAPAHEKGFLSLMDDFNARGGAHTAATRRLVDGGLFSKEQLAAAAAKAKSIADARAPNGELTPENRLAAARARLATEGRVVATVAQRPSKSGSSAVKGVSSQGLIRPQPPSDVSFTLGNPRLPTRPKMPTYVSTTTAQPGSSTTNDIEQPVHNELTIRRLLANKPQPEVEAGRASTGHSVIRTHPIYDRGQAPRTSSTKLASAAAAAPTTTTPSQSVSEKVQAIVRYYGDALNAFDDATAAKFVAHKLKEDTNLVDLDAGKTSSTKLAAATKTTGTTPSQSVSEKVQAILHSYGDAMNAFDNASAAGFVAYKLKEDADFDAGGKHSTKLTAATKTTGTASSQSVSEKVQAILHSYGDAMNAFDDASAAGFVAYKPKEDADFDAGGKHSTKLAAATKTTGTTSSQSVSEKEQAIAHRYASAVGVSRKPAQNVATHKVAAQKLDERIINTDINTGKEISTQAQLKSPASNHAQSTNNLKVKRAMAKTAEVDHDFDVLTSQGPSAANGSPLPDPDLSMDQLDLEFSPTMKGFQGWEDDYDSDDSEEWDLGGLAEWKWVGEKSAQQSSAAKGQA